ncbi:MAG TPA: biotin/lipoyl-containing protein, partial [Chloroflexota bacterium]
LEVVQGDARLYVRREPGSRSPAAAAPAPVVEGASDTVPVVAPLTGAYYGRPSPEQSPFVVVGQPVEAGQVVALIESMKLFNEVSAEIGGEVAEIAALDGDVVEVGQPLLYIRPHMEGDAT